MTIINFKGLLNAIKFYFVTNRRSHFLILIFFNHVSPRWFVCQAYLNFFLFQRVFPWLEIFVAPSKLAALQPHRSMTDIAQRWLAFTFRGVKQKKEGSSTSKWERRRPKEINRKRKKEIIWAQNREEEEWARARICHDLMNETDQKEIQRKGNKRVRENEGKE